MKPTYYSLTYIIVWLRIKILRSWHTRDLSSLIPCCDFVTIEYYKITDLLSHSLKSAKFYIEVCKRDSTRNGYCFTYLLGFFAGPQ